MKKTPSLVLEVRKITLKEHSYFFTALASCWGDVRYAKQYSMLWNKAGFMDHTYILFGILADGTEVIMGGITARAPDILVFAVVKKIYQKMGLFTYMLKHFRMDNPQKVKRIPVKKGNYQTLVRRANWIIDPLCLTYLQCNQLPISGTTTKGEDPR